MIGICFGLVAWCLSTSIATQRPSQAPRPKGNGPPMPNKYIANPGSALAFAPPVLFLICEPIFPPGHDPCYRPAFQLVGPNARHTKWVTKEALDDGTPRD
ncbi:hypothetical protein FOPE_01916 [Fonsecaea pedrosoi]|nr:hypothetical protein FOPE_01916 [Fonsecaea pedrosoi]